MYRLYSFSICGSAVSDRIGACAPLTPINHFLSGLRRNKMAPQTGKGAKDLASGAVLQCIEAASLGMPFEVWKTRMGRFRDEGTFRSFIMVYKSAGGGVNGVRAYWKGLAPKMVESASKGAVLMFSKEAIKDAALTGGATPFVAGLVGGAGGGVMQVCQGSFSIAHGEAGLRP